MAARQAALFSKQDSRFVQMQEDFSAAQMMADLGDHRILDLPLSGRPNPRPPPPPDVLKRGSKTARKALPDTVSATWNTLFDPSLVVERNDGLGDGQSHRTGPNYRPTGANAPRSHPSTGSRPFLSPSIQTAPSALRISRSPSNGVGKTYARARPQPLDNLRPDKRNRPAQIGSNAFATFISHLRSEPSAGPISIRSITRDITREIPDNPSVSHWNSGSLVVANAKRYDYIQPDIPTAPRLRESNTMVAAERMNTAPTPLALPKAAPRAVRKDPRLAVETKLTPPTSNNSIIESLRDSSGVGSANRSGSSPSPLDTRPAIRRLPAAFSVKEPGAPEAKQRLQKAVPEVSNKSALEVTNSPHRAHPSGGAQTQETNEATTAAGPSRHAGPGSRTPPDIQKLMEVLEERVKHLSQSIAKYKLGNPESASSGCRHRVILEVISSERNHLFEYILSEEERLGEIKKFLKGIENKEREIMKGLEVAVASHDSAKEGERERIVPKKAEKTADEERARLEKARREPEPLEELHIEQGCIEMEQMEKSRINQDKGRLRQETLDKERLFKEGTVKESAEKAVHREQPENERPNKELNVINVALKGEELESGKREELRANAEARELARLQGEILEENHRRKRVEGGDGAGLNRKEREVDHPATVQLLEKPSNVESSTLAGAGRYPAPLEPQENARNAVPKGPPSPPPFPYRVEIQLRPLFDKPSVVTWVDQSVEPQAAIDKALSEVLTETEVSVLVGLPPFKLFLARTVERHSRKMAKVHGGI